MRRINQTVVVAGPSCSGKSFLIERLQRGQYQQLNRQLGGLNFSSSIYIKARELKQMDARSIDSLVVHYDFYNQQRDEKQFNYLSDLIDESDATFVLTLDVPSSILIERLNSRIYNMTLEYLSNLLIRKRKTLWEERRKNKIKRLWGKRKAYKREGCDHIYRQWFDFLSQFKEIRHWKLTNREASAGFTFPWTIDEIFNRDSGKRSGSLSTPD